MKDICVVDNLKYLGECAFTLFNIDLYIFKDNQWKRIKYVNKFRNLNDKALNLQTMFVSEEEDKENDKFEHWDDRLWCDFLVGRYPTNYKSYFKRNENVLLRLCIRDDRMPTTECSKIIYKEVLEMEVTPKKVDLICKPEEIAVENTWFKIVSTKDIDNDSL